LLDGWRAGRVGEVEDILGEGEVGEFDVLRIRPHDDDGDWRLLGKGSQAIKRFKRIEGGER
jgi:hypothetical protein